MGRSYLEGVLEERGNAEEFGEAEEADGRDKGNGWIDPNFLVGLV